MSFLEKTFKLKENKTNISTELTAGFTTFMTMAYILAVNPMILSNTGMDKGALFTATAISAAIGTLLMALLANLPFALAPGMGLNVMFAFTIVVRMGVSWESALAIVFIEGIIFTILTLFNVREAIINAIPSAVKNAISVGIGFFIALVGFTGSGITGTGMSHDGKELVGTVTALGDLTSPSSMVALFGLLLTGVLVVRKVKGAMLIGIMLSTILSFFVGLADINKLEVFKMVPSIEPIFMKFDFSNIFSLEMLSVLFVMLFVDLFDTLGTLIGVSNRANLLNKDGTIPKAKQALLADSLATTCGAVLGTSTVTTYVESASGVAEGGRTGLSSVFTALFFVVSLFFSGIFLAVPSAATAPALIIVGMYMMAPVTKIDWNKYEDAIPAFLTISLMPFTYSIAEGISFGVISATLIAVFSSKTSKLKLGTYILTIFFIAKIAFQLIK